MFGTLGTQELVFIFLLALLLFGPKKLPEIGRTVGKALTEFRRASNDLKATFDREMRTLEAETKSLDVTNQYQHDTYNYDYSSYENSYEGSYGTETYDSNAASTTTASASAPEGAESPSAVAPEGTVAQGTELAAVDGLNGASPEHPEAVEHAATTPAEHNA
jgi:TatA/E family protein of Tat protein translocase